MNEFDVSGEPSGHRFSSPIGEVPSGETIPGLEEDIFVERYEDAQVRLESRRADAIKNIERKTERATVLAERYREKHGVDPEPGQVDKGVVAAQRGLQVIEGKLRFLRPSSEADIAYQRHISADLPSAIRSSTPDGLPLRFHAAPIYTSHEIIKNGHGLSSSEDRLGIETSYDVAGQVSVTTPQTLETSVESYLGLFEEQGCVPPGCIFVLLPDSPEDAAAGDASMLMGNVDFVEDPTRLVAILATPETTPQVKEWAREGKIDEGRVQEFFEFAENLSGLKARIESGEASLDDYIPYDLARTQA